MAAGGAATAEMSCVSSSSAAAAMLATGAVRWEPPVQAQCVAEFAPCTQQNCCAPHRCWRQSAFYGQCGAACPRDAGWECHHSPRIALLVGRFGGWPAWTPLWLKTLGASRGVDFHVLSDAPPVTGTLPPNVIYHSWTLDGLLVRLRATVGAKLRTLHATGAFASGVSASKLNDFKPMLGEAFASDLLQPYDWWGYLQEDLLIGNLSRLATPALLADADVVSPYFAPFNSSGVLMLWRNEQRVRTLWRLSRDAPRVLSSPTYLVFDEGWWGALAHADSISAVLGREAAAGRLRLTRATARGADRWMADDKRYQGQQCCTRLGGNGTCEKLNVVTRAQHARGFKRGGAAAAAAASMAAANRTKVTYACVPAPAFNDALTVCWRGGALWANPGASGDPCGGGRLALSGARQVGVVHLSLLKRRAAWNALEWGADATAALAAADTFAVTADGAWVPADGRQRAEHHLLVSGAAPAAALPVRSDALAEYLRGLARRDDALRCNPNKAWCRGAGEPPARPCVERHPKARSHPCGRLGCVEALRASGMALCAGGKGD